MPRPSALVSPRSSLVAGIVLLIVVAGLGLAVTGARAATWTLASCAQPNGQPAPVDGWRPGVWAGGPVAGSGDIDGCAAGGPLTAVSNAASPVASFTGPEWVFTAPPNSTIAGGTINATLSAAVGQSWIGTPTPAFDAADVIAACPAGAPCGTGGTLSGLFAISHPGGTQIFAPALCVYAGGGACPAGAVPNAEVDIHAAEIELSTSAAPRLSDVTGRLLTPRVGGTADVRFDAADLGDAGGSGPGIYGVTVQLDGRTTYTGVPNTFHGRCVALGTDPATGGLIFDHGQPCAPSARISIPVDTTTVGDGAHVLTLTVSDAAGEVTTATRRITTSNPELSPAPAPGPLATRLLTGWARSGRRTTLATVVARDLPPTARLSVACTGAGCPALPVSHARAARAGRLWSALKTVGFAPGQRLQVTVSLKTAETITVPGAHHHRHRRVIHRRASETITFRFRRGAAPRIAVAG
jgi:hypothetical protein